MGCAGLRRPCTLLAIHAGVALALSGGLLATALNSYSQHEIVFDGAPSAWTRDRHGYGFRLVDLRVASAGVEASVAPPACMR